MTPKLQHDAQFQIGFYEKVLARSPNFIEALMCLGDLYTKEGLFEKGLQMDERLAQLRPQDPIVFYNLACSYSLVERIPEAQETMHRALALGYGDLEYLVKDPDLVNLLAHQPFRAHVESLRSGDFQGGKREEAA